MAVPTSCCPQVQVLVDNSQQSEEEDCHLCGDERRQEDTYLLGTAATVWKSKCRNGRCCITSKAALLILFWNVSISILVTSFFDSSLYINPTGYFYNSKNISKLIFKPDTRVTITPAVFSIAAILYLFFPLAGCLADIRWGRYKAVINGLWSDFFLVLILAICAGVYLVIIKYTKINHQIVFELFSDAFFCVLAVAILPGYITFSANVIQFGMDQLHDSPSEDSVLFIHWFVFSSSLGSVIANVPSSWIDAKRWIPRFVFEFLSLITVTLLGVSLCFARCKRQWFLVDTGSRNPYKLVYKVIQFAAHHKTPIRRSAFTYCEDELPSRMDLGKEKYGGPFTTEQVEDVKAFLGILCILLTLGPTFTVDIAVNRMLPTISLHLQSNVSTSNSHYFNLVQVNILQDILNTILIPVYICLLRPFVLRCVPGMLKRIGLGMAMLLLSSLCMLTIDTIGHIMHSNNVCFLNTDYFTYYRPTDANPDSLNISVYYLTFPYVLNSLGYLFFYVAVYELICSQSPSAMKGLLVGTLFTVKGTFQFIGATALLIPFISWHFKASFPSCGFVYYIINVVVAVSGLVAYTVVARRYQYRERDEPDNIYRYAEDYYDRDGDDSYDYSSDQDIFNVHTINNIN